MHYTENGLNVLTALSFKGIGNAWVVDNLYGGESVEHIVTLLQKKAKEPVNHPVFLARKQQVTHKLMASRQHADGLVAWGDAHFPSHRGKVKNSEKPVALVYKGDLDLLAKTHTNIAVIGLLQPDPQTDIRERKLVERLVKDGAVIVSGLAKGCDAIAHQQTLQNGGKTVAILPSPLYDVMPAENKALAQQIWQSGGLVITEYFENALSQREMIGRYQERDRLQALFSDAIVLAASYAKNDLGLDSGSRLAMEYAQQYGIARAVMYEPMQDESNPKYALNRQIISEGQVSIIGDDAASQMLKHLIDLPSNRDIKPVSVEQTQAGFAF